MNPRTTGSLLEKIQPPLDSSSPGKGSSKEPSPDPRALFQSLEFPRNVKSLQGSHLGVLRERLPSKAVRWMICLLQKLSSGGLEIN